MQTNLHALAHLRAAENNRAPPAQNAICTRICGLLCFQYENNKKAGGHFSWRSGKNSAVCALGARSPPIYTYICILYLWVPCAGV
jgi:hypothetical protein